MLSHEDSVSLEGRAEAIFVREMLPEAQSSAERAHCISEFTD